MGESPGLAVLEALLAVPSLKFGVLTNYSDADGLNGCSPGMLEDVLNKTGANSVVAMQWKDRQAVQVSKSGAGVFVGDATEGQVAFFEDEIRLAARKIGFDPAFRAERWVLWAVLGVQSELCCDIFV